MRILLNGVTSCNSSVVERETGLSHTSVLRFVRGKATPSARTRELLGLFIWRRLNAHLLLSDADRQPPH
jgi:hypothetical protein